MGTQLRTAHLATAGGVRSLWQATRFYRIGPTPEELRTKPIFANLHGAGRTFFGHVLSFECKTVNKKYAKCK
jgi:hypothetical protein